MVGQTKRISIKIQYCIYLPRKEPVMLVPDFLTILIPVFICWIIIRLILSISRKRVDFHLEMKYSLFLFSLTFIYSYTIAPFPFFMEQYTFIDLEYEMKSYNLIPFNSIFGSLQHFYFMVPLRNIGGNILLFVPLGLSLAFLRPTLSWKKIVLLGLITSLMVEITQWFIPFRSLDIDDLILNTLGTFFGYVAFHIIKGITAKWVKHKDTAY